MAIRRNPRDGNGWSKRKSRKGLLVIPLHECDRSLPCRGTNRSTERGTVQQVNLKPPRSSRITQRPLMHVEFLGELIQRDQLRVATALFDCGSQPVKNACRRPS